MPSWASHAPPGPVRTHDTTACFEREEAHTMELALYGLGRMGGNMVIRLQQGGHRVIAGNRSRGPVDEAIKHGVVPAYTIEEMVRELQASPKIVWLMVPAG